MDEQQASEALTSILEDAFDNATHQTLGGYGSDRVNCQDMITESVPKILELFPAQQSPTDAVAFLVWCEKNGVYKNSRDEWIIKGCIYPVTPEAIYKLFNPFNPSGAAPQPEPAYEKKCLHCGRYKVFMFDSDNDRCESCNKIFPAVATTKVTAPAPPAAGPVTDKLVKALEQVVALGKGELDKKFFGCAMTDCIAALHDYYKGENTTRLTPAGPVWVKGDQRVPPDTEDYHLIMNMGSEADPTYMCSVGAYDPTKEAFKCEIMGYYLARERVQWLDETYPQQVFTREQVRDMVRKAWVANYEAQMLDDDPLDIDFCNAETDKWFDLNYPPINK